VRWSAEQSWTFTLLLGVTLFAFLGVSVDYRMGVVWIWVVAFLMSTFVPKFATISQDRSWLERAWMARVMVVMVLGVWVEGYYRMRTGLDADMYHRVASYVVDFFKKFQTLPEVERHQLFWDGTVHYILQTAVFYGLLGPSAQMMKVINTTVAFLGTVGFYRVYRHVRPGPGMDLPLLFLFFMPSTLYWTSIHGKDPWMYAFLGLAAFSAHRYLETISIHSFLGILLGVAGMAWIRPHVAAIFSLALAAFATLWMLGKRKAHPFARMVWIALVVLVAALAVRAVMLAFNVFSPEDVLAFTTRQGEVSAYGHSAIQVPRVASFQDLFLFSPIGFLTVLFRPFPWEARSPFALISSLENLILLMFSLMILRKRRLTPEHPVGLLAGLYVLFFVLAFYPAVGNLGTLVRQKVQLLPFWFIYIGSLPSRERAHVRD